MEIRVLIARLRHGGLTGALYSLRNAGCADAEGAGGEDERVGDGGGDGESEAGRGAACRPTDAGHDGGRAQDRAGEGAHS
eukprot:953679-Prorocentrum_minimum.AAC.1